MASGRNIRVLLELILLFGSLVLSSFSTAAFVLVKVGFEFLKSGIINKILVKQDT